MSDEDLNRALAEALGWQWWEAKEEFLLVAPGRQWPSIYGLVQVERPIEGKLLDYPNATRHKAILIDGIPRYANDLNACHEARKQLTTPAQKVAYQNKLHALAEPKVETRNYKGQGLVSDWDAHTQGPREIAEAILFALTKK